MSNKLHPDYFIPLIEQNALVLDNKSDKWWATYQPPSDFTYMLFCEPPNTWMFTTKKHYSLESLMSDDDVGIKAFKSTLWVIGFSECIGDKVEKCFFKPIRLEHFRELVMMDNFDVKRKLAADDEVASRLFMLFNL